MSAAQNLGYSLVQVAHNFGAVAVVSGAVFSFFAEESRVNLVKLNLSGWVLQGISGALFGLLSYSFYGHFPDISGVAMNALFLKIACAVMGFFLSIFYLLRAKNWSEAARFRLLLALSFFSLTAISSAAFLRWFS